MITKTSFEEEHDGHNEDLDLDLDLGPIIWDDDDRQEEQQIVDVYQDVSG